MSDYGIPLADTEGLDRAYTEEKLHRAMNLATTDNAARSVPTAPGQQGDIMPDPMEEQLAAQVVAEAEDIAAGRDPRRRKGLVRIHRGDTVDFSVIDRSYTSEFLRGYGLAVDWFAKGAPTSEAHELCLIYLDSRPGDPAEEATFVLDATRFPSLLAHFTQLEVFDGEEYQAKCVRDHGASFLAANYPKQAFAWHTAGTPMHEGFLTAIHQVVEG